MDRLQRFSGTGTVRTDGGDRSVDELSEALADPRRRIVVSALLDADSSVPVADIVDRIADEKQRDTDRDGSPPDRQRIRTSLVQVHIPKLFRANVASHDDDAGTVVPKPALDDTRALLKPADSSGGSV
ncbi:DUF7344 domain-containing protein [Halostella pelagica]